MVAFCCCAFGDKRYIEQQARLKHSILQIYPDAPLFFWTNEMPPGARSMSESLYGFKPHAVRLARDYGHKQIIFFDPAMVLLKKVDYYQQIVHNYGVIAVQDDNKLSKFCGDRALKEYNLTRNDIKDWHLVGGSFYYFDFDLPLCECIFQQWITDEEEGLFGSQKEQASEQLQGHRNDEAMMALCLYTNGSKPINDDHRYNCENMEVAILKKYHFK
jgi:hypothetical protein